MNLPPFKYIKSQGDWQRCIALLRQQARIAIDLEANSLYAYQEQVCLIQITIPGQDYIVDPIVNLDLAPLGEIIEDPTVEKIFHAAEYDLILLTKEYGWKMKNLFDTMWASRILGIKRVGLANILEDRYAVKLNKKHQKANWCRRPLSASQLAYAQSDTHYLHQLRNDLAQELQSANRYAEAQEIFAEQTFVEATNKVFDPDSFWSINGVRDLDGRQKAILKALNIYRDKEAKRQNRPHFKVFGEKTMLQIAQQIPENINQMSYIHGMTSGQIKRYGQHLLRIVRENKDRPAPKRPSRNHNRPSEEISNRYERLHNWRKQRAKARGVESDVILNRQKLWQLAHSNPQSIDELSKTAVLGPWQFKNYGEEILDIIKKD